MAKCHLFHVSCLQVQCSSSYEDASNDGTMILQNIFQYSSPCEDASARLYKNHILQLYDFHIFLTLCLYSITKTYVLQYEITDIYL